MPRRLAAYLLLAVMFLAVALAIVLAVEFWRFWGAPPPRPSQTDPVSGSELPLQERLQRKGLKSGNPAFVRIFKREGLLELWLQQNGAPNGRYTLFQTYPICRWSGNLGPKLREGDWQSPEGFYTVTAKQLKPDSAHFRAFNIGFPNAYDRQLGRTGSFLMVHGGCSSVGCYAMTNPAIAEIYGLVEAALQTGQKEVPVHIFPFKFGEDTLKAEASSKWIDFWQNLKDGHDRFETTGQPPASYVCQNRYAFDLSKAKAKGCTKIAGW